MNVESTSYNVPVVDHATLEKYLISKYISALKRKFDPPCSTTHILGPAGMGKTYTVYEVARKLARLLNKNGLLPTPDISEDPGDLGEKVVVITNLAETMTPVDVSPTYVDQEKGVSRKYPPEWLVRLSTRNVEAVKAVEAFRRGKKTGNLPVAVIVWDELRNAMPETLKAIQTLLGERRVETTELLPTVMQVATSNVMSDNAQLTDLSSPQKSRLAHLFLNPPRPEDWIAWALRKGADERVLAYISMYPDHLFIQPEATHQAYPCPRSWYYAATEMRGLDDEMATLAVSAHCGQTIGYQFRTFLDTTKDMDIEEVLRNPGLFYKLQVPSKHTILLHCVSRLRQSIEDMTYDPLPATFIAAILYGVEPDEVPEVLARRLVAVAYTFSRVNRSDDVENSLDVVYRAITMHNRGIAENTLTEQAFEIARKNLSKWAAVLKGKKFPVSKLKTKDNKPDPTLPFMALHGKRGEPEMAAAALSTLNRALEGKERYVSNAWYLTGVMAGEFEYCK